MKRITFLILTLVVFGVAASFAAKKQQRVMSDREYWASQAYRIAAPVLEPMSRGMLSTEMQIEVSPSFDSRDKRVTYMECFGRLMAGIAPWLSLPDDDTPEGKERRKLKEWALKAYAEAVNPDSKDYLLWRKEGQPLVDAAYIAESLIRGFDALWKPLDETTKARYIDEFTRLRRVEPPYTNWLLFAAEIESFLAKAGAPYDSYRVNGAVRKCEEWYVGDGWYSDGQGTFAFDYYSTKRLLEKFKDWPEFGLNFDPSHLYWQGIKPHLFLEDFIDRVYHVHMKDCAVTLNGRSGLLCSHIDFGDLRRGWNFRSTT